MPSMQDMVELVRKQRELQASPPATGMSAAAMPTAFARVAAPDQGNGGTVEGNVAALNRQIDAMRSLREARNPGITTGANQGAFGDLVSIGTPGGNFGDEAMQQEQAKSMIRQASGTGLSRGQRRALMQGASLMAGLETPGVKRLAPDPTALTDYQRGQLGLSRDQLAAETSAQKSQASLAQGRLDWERSHGQAQLAADAAAKQSLVAYQQGQLELGRDENAIKRLEIQNRAPSLSKGQEALQTAQAKASVDQAQTNMESLRNAADLFQKTAQLREMTNKTGLLNSGMAMIGAPFNSQAATDKERFDALSSGMVLSAIKQLGANPSNADLAFVNKAAPEFGKTPEGNRQILSDMENFALGKLQAAGIDTSQFTPSQPEQAVGGMAKGSAAAVEQRGAALAAQGLPREKIMAQLEREYGSAFKLH